MVERPEGEGGGDRVVACLRDAPWEALQRAHRGHLVAVGGASSETLTADFGARVRAALKDTGLESSLMEIDGACLRVCRLKASQPAFGGRQRQALLIGACLDPTRPWPPPASPEPIAAGIARGGLLAAHALTALVWLAGRVNKGELATGRDLLVVFEGPAEPGQGAPCASTSDVLGRLLAPCAFAIAETGGQVWHSDGVPLLPVAVGRKGVVRLVVRARGEPLDPGQPDDRGAAERLLEALARVTVHAWPLRVSATARAFIQAVGGAQTLRRSLAWRALLNPATHARSLRRLSAGERRLVAALLHDTIVVTRLVAGARDDMGAEVAEATLDARLVPGRTTSDLLGDLRGLLGEDLELEVLGEAPAVEADLHGPLLRALCETLQTHLPGARAVPTLQTADTPGLAWRQTQVPCYGFAPVGLAPGIAFDTGWRAGRATVDDAGLAWGLRVFIDAITRFLVEG